MKKIEIFSADCPLCREMIENVKGCECCKDAEIVIRTCSGDTCCDPAKGYEIKSVPTVVVNGKVAIEGKHSKEEIKKILESCC